MGSWADALTSGEVSPQANKASPASLMFMAATQSALAENPHSTQANCACLLRLSPEVCPHSRHWRLVLIGGTATSMPPRHLVLYSNWRRSSNGLASRMERLRPDLALTLLPGCSLVPAADADIFFTCRSSTMTTAWFLLMSDETLCRKCFLVLAIRWAKCYWKNVLCSPSYFAASCGGPPLHLIKRYIEQQATPH